MQRVRSAGRISLRSSIIPIGLVALAALVTYATVPTSTAGAQESTAEDLYSFNCSSCHQPGGVGRTGVYPPLAGNPAAEDPDYVRSVITEGKSGPLDVLGVLKSENVRVDFIDSNSSCLIQDPDDETARYVIMPMRL